MPERRDSELLAAITAAEDRLTNYMNNRFNDIDRRFNESLQDRRSFERKIWEELDNHYGRKANSHHSQLEVRIDNNEKMSNRAMTIYKTIAVILGLLYSVTVLFGRAIKNFLFGHPS